MPRCPTCSGSRIGGVVVVATYAICLAVIAGLERLWHPRGSIPLYALFGAVGGIPITIFVFLFNRLVFSSPAMEFLQLLVYASAIAAVGSAVIASFTRSLASQPPQAADAARRPVLLDRLPLELRGPISRLSVQDHYVEVHTDKGRHLLLMRLSDAIGEMAGIDGLQVHRSHWVATGAVRTSVRRDGRLHLNLADGSDIPVSRSYLKAVRAAGLA